MSNTPLKPLVDPIKVQHDLAFGELTVNAAMIKQASLYAFYATQAARADRRMMRAKQAMEIKRSEIASKVRTQAADENEKVTEAAVADAVNAHPQYHEAYNLYVDARFEADLAKQVCEAFRQRKDMIINVAKRQLEEAKGEVRVFDREPEEPSTLFSGTQES